MYYVALELPSNLFHKLILRCILLASEIFTNTRIITIDLNQLLLNLLKYFVEIFSSVEVWSLQPKSLNTQWNIIT